jgi:pteridine reductase
MDTDDRIALVTGAATRIGAAIAEALHQRGCGVLIHCNASTGSAAALAASLNGIRADSAWVLCADLSAANGPQRLASACKQLTSRLDVLVNNASRFYPTVAGETGSAQWDDLLNSNLRGPYFLCQELLEPLRCAGGSIVNILDVHAQRPMTGHAVYCMSKAGLAMMTLALARELAPHIRVNGVAPGAILWPEPPPSEAVQNTILSRTALGRIGQPGDVASAAAYLALDAPYVTGQILAVDGGRSLHM